MATVAQISIQYPGIEVFNTTPIRDNASVTPLTLARYALYNRDLANFGLNDADYLAYQGGFITQEDKINVKYSNFQITGNFTVDRTSQFRNNISILSQAGNRDQNITNVKNIGSVEEFSTTAYDNDALTIKDFKDFLYQKGMIMMWAGTWEQLRDELPYWRLCAPPDAGKVFNGVTVPNLIGRFVPAAGIQANNIDLYRTGQTVDKNNEVGYDAAAISEEQMPRHSHNVTMSAVDDFPRLTLDGSQRNDGDIRFAFSGGGVTLGYSTANNSCGTKSIACTCTCDSSCEGYWNRGKCDTATKVRKVTAPSSVVTTTDVNVSDFTSSTISWTNEGASIASQSEQNKGLGQSHESRPRYYALAYIIYVGEGAAAR